MSKTAYQRRVPRQARSRARVEHILQTAVDIIAEEGADALKMNDVASRAEISIGSLYQYFPDKTALIHALTERMLNAAREQVEAAMADVTTLDDAIAALSQLCEEHCERMRADAALRDIWYGMQADRALQHLDIEDSRLVGQRIFEAVSQFLPRRNHKQLRSFLFMSAHLLGATARMATSLSPREGRIIIREFQSMLVLRIRELQH